MTQSPKSPLHLLEPGALLGGALVQDWMDRDAKLPKTGDPIGPFRVVREIARGGMGVVYEAERADGQFEQRVALKWLLVEPNAIHAELFRRERQTLARMQHPHIAHLIDGGQLNGQPWLAMAFIDGLPLDQHVVQKKASVAACLQLILAVGEALQYAHTRGVLHCDVKPSNVLVDQNGQVKLLDFGIASLSQDARSNVSAFTAGYASPEQVRGEPATVLSEVFQLARLAKKVFTLSVESETQGEETLANAKSIPDELNAILDHALQDDPSRRYPSVDAMLNDLRAVMGTRPIQIRAHDRVYVAKKFLARNALLASTVAISLLLAGAVIAVAYSRVRAERDRANHEAKVSATVLEFLETDLLASADPGALPGREMTVRQALDRAAENLHVRFAAQPVERRAIARTLARLYDELGVTDKAAQFAQAVLDDNDWVSPQVFEDRILLAEIWIGMDRLAEAEKLLSALTLVDAKPTNAKPTNAHTTLAEWQVLELARLQSRLYFHQGDYQASVAALKPLLDQRNLDAVPPNVVQQYVQSLSMLGDQAQALHLSQPLLETMRVRWGPLHPVTLAHQHDLGVLLRHLGRTKEAVTVLQDCLNKRRAVLKSDHPETVRSMNELATALQGDKQFEPAEVLFREALTTRETIYGENNALTRNSMSNLGLLLNLSGRYAEASALYERVLSLEFDPKKKPHPDTIALMHNMAELYRKQLRFQDALQMHERVLQAAAQTVGKESWQYAMFLVGQAKTVRATKGKSAADLIMAQAENTMTLALGDDHANTEKLRKIRAQLQSDPD